MKKAGKRRESLGNVALIVYDFDGVLTDNRVIVREDGMESVVVNRSDGLAIGMIKARGIRQVILSKERNRVVRARARKLDIPCLHGIDDKRAILAGYCRKNAIPLKRVVYLGNEINDLEVMKAVGHPMCPSDAYPEVKKAAKTVLRVPGGAGVARELLTLLREGS